MLDALLTPEIQDLIRARAYRDLRSVLKDWSASEVAGLIDALAPQDDVLVFRLLPRELAAETFAYLSAEKQEDLIEALATKQHRLSELLNDLAPDDRTALLEELPGPVVRRLLGLLSPSERQTTLVLLGYPEDSVGRLMTPEYVAVRPGWPVAQALDHIRAHGRDSETLDVIYVVDERGVLVDDLRIREVLLADPEAPIESLMDSRFVALAAADDQENAVTVFRTAGRVALPVVDAGGILVGIVTVDDVLDVAEAEATEDIQKIGGAEALDAPYFETSFRGLVKKRARWLVVLFLGEMLTATAMGYYEAEIARAVVLALFVPLIISSGGNSGSQAASLMIRAIALGEVRLRDWWRVMRREVFSGLTLGGILGAVGFVRVVVWGYYFGAYGEHWFLVAVTVALSLVGVVLWGTFAGSMLPFVMKRLGEDPAASSAPFVATLVDVTGLVIYFTVASIILAGTVL